MNPFLPDEVEALRALARTWPNAKMVVLGAAALRCFMPMSWRTPVGIAVDIVPASDEALARGYVEWPRSGFRMSLLGMRLAFEHAVALQIAADLDVRVTPIHVISALKMIAYSDRPEVRAKDLGDLAPSWTGTSAMTRTEDSRSKCPTA